jgi:hypothetical protein
MPLQSHIEDGIDLVRIVRDAYRKDKVLSKVLKAPKEHAHQSMHDGLIWTKNLYRRNVVCIPHSAFLKGRRLIEVIIDHAHQVVGHIGQLKTSNYI